MATTSMPAPEAQASVGSFGRMVGVITSPTKTFADIAQRPSWVVPLLLMCLLSVGVGGLIGQKTDWRGFFERQMAKNSRFDNMSQDQKENILQAQMKWAPPMSYGIGAFFIVVGSLVLALIYWGSFNLFCGAGLRFGQGFAITVHAFVPTIISSILAIIILLIKPRGDIDPEHFLATSLSAFLPDDAPHWMEVLGQSLELFWIWCIALVAVGFAAANPRKVKKGTAFGIVFGLWIIWVLARVGWAAM
jgi:Yip1 domain